MNSLYRTIASLATVAVLGAPMSQFGQQGQAGDGVIRINVNLVQVDAVVTDSKGKPVTDLKADDFELLQDGKPQTITNFSFINTKTPGVRGAVGRGAVQPRNGPPRPIAPSPSALRPDQIRRTIALVVDDLGLSWDSIVHVRQALKKWVDEQMQPGDLVAIIRTSAGMGALQQFTGDKRLLALAIDRVQFHFGRVGISSFAPLTGAAPAGSIDTSAFDQELEQRYSIGSMGAIQYVVEGLRELPGRKSLVLFSESMQLTYPDGRSQLVEEQLRKLSDAANRSSVVIYAVDPRGVIYTGLTAEDRTAGMTSQQIAAVGGQRTQQLIASQEGMITLAQKTGGLFIHDNNDIEGALRGVVEDGNGYYLLGYHPDATTFDVRTGTPRFHSIKVRVKRPGLEVRSRTGFFGTPDRRLAPPAQTQQAQLSRALYSPFATGALSVRLTTLFSQSEKEGGYINAMMFIDAHNLTFVPEADEMTTATFDTAAVTFDGEGHAVDSGGKTWRLRIPKSAYNDVLKQGLVYSLHVAVKKAGPYQMRAVLRDENSQEVGSATSFIDVPDVNKGRLALSGIVLAAERPHAQNAGEDAAEGRVSADDPNGTAAVRIFKQGATIVYAYQILNAQSDRDKKAELEVQTRLFRDGQEVFATTPSPMKSEPQQNPKRLLGLGQLQLTQTPPGDYILQILVTDKLAKDKYKLAAQSMDFEVRR